MHVSRFCGCYSIETGGFVIGFLSIILSISSIISIALTSHYALCLMVTPFGYLVCAVLLILGIQERRVEFVFPAVCLFFVSLIVGLPTVCIYCVLTIKYHGAQVSLFFATMIGGCFCFAVIGYSFLVVKSIYKELLRDKYTLPRVESYNVFYTSHQNEQHI